MELKKLWVSRDDAIVNALFLKTPERIEALGLILLISLLIWRMMESEMRRYLKETNQQLHGWDNKLTSRPTSYVVTKKFKGVWRRILTPESTRS